MIASRHSVSPFSASSSACLAERWEYQTPDLHLGRSRRLPAFAGSPSRLDRLFKIFTLAHLKSRWSDSFFDDIFQDYMVVVGAVERLLEPMRSQHSTISLEDERDELKHSLEQMCLCWESNEILKVVFVSCFGSRWLNTSSGFESHILVNSSRVRYLKWS
jgi:hypothetical protein